MRYWNGYQWVDGYVDESERRVLLDVELNPRTTTDEEPKLSGAVLEMVASGEIDDPVDTIKAMVEQPPPNMIDRSVDVFSKNSPCIGDVPEDEVARARVITRDRQENGMVPLEKPVDDGTETIANMQMCDKCSSEYNVDDGQCPVCLMLYGTPAEIAAHVAKDKR